MSFIYLGGVWAKLQGSTWNDGTAVGYALRIEDLVRFQAPSFLSESLLMANILTYGTLAVVVGVAILIWNSRARPWAIAMGVGLHLVIEYTLRVGFFSWAMLIVYLAFVPPSTVAQGVDRTRGLLSSRLARTRRLETTALPPPVGAAPVPHP